MSDALLGKKTGTALPIASSRASECSVANYRTRNARAREGLSSIWQEKARKARLSELARSDYLLRWLQQEPSGPIGFRKLVQFAPLAFRTKAGAERALFELIRRGLMIEVLDGPAASS